jgi:hypothetical protein
MNADPKRKTHKGDYDRAKEGSSNKLPSSFRVLSALIVVAERSDGGKLPVTCPRGATP